VRFSGAAVLVLLIDFVLEFLCRLLDVLLILLVRLALLVLAVRVPLLVFGLLVHVIAHPAHRVGVGFLLRVCVGVVRVLVRHSPRLHPVHRFASLFVRSRILVALLRLCLRVRLWVVLRVRVGLVLRIRVALITRLGLILLLRLVVVLRLLALLLGVALFL